MSKKILSNYVGIMYMRPWILPGENTLRSNQLVKVDRDQL